MLVYPIELEFGRGDFGTLPGAGSIPPEDTTVRTPRKLFTAVFTKVSQPLFQLYRLTLGIDQLRVARDITQEDLRLQRQTIIRNVKSAYFAVLKAQSALEAAAPLVGDRA
jgi:outer membrane protein TolC